MTDTYDVYWPEFILATAGRALLRTISDLAYAKLFRPEHVALSHANAWKIIAFPELVVDRVRERMAAGPGFARP
jgi:hypothetical protein